MARAAGVAIPMSDARPIGILDSGFGGLGVLARAARLAAGERFVYYGDFAHAPYGSKAPDEVARVVDAACARLLERGAKALVLACNTATSAAVAKLRARLDLPVIGMEPALKPAVAAHPDGRILVMATTLTLRERKFRALLERLGAGRRLVELPCPGLSSAVDTGDPEAAAVRARELLDGCPGAREARAVVLGCSHYLFVADAVREWFGGGVALYEGSEGTARRLVALLDEHGLRAASCGGSDGGKNDSLGGGRIEMLLPGAPPGAQAVARRLLERAGRISL